LWGISVWLSVLIENLIIWVYIFIFLFISKQNCEVVLVFVEFVGNDEVNNILEWLGELGVLKMFEL
jgi:hypothetical protein